MNPQDENDCTLYFRDNFRSFELRTFQIISVKISAKVSPKDGVTGASFKIKDKINITMHNYTTFELETCQDSLSSKDTCISETVDINYMFYQGRAMMGRERGSGAYAFAPTKNDPEVYGKVLEAKLYEGGFLSILQVSSTSLIS